MANLIGVMDRLWFHQIILFSESTSLLLVTRNLIEHPQLNIKSLTYPSSSIASSNQSSSGFLLATPDEGTSSPPQHEEISSKPPLITTPLDDSDIEQKEPHEDVSTKERPTRLNLVTSRVRSHSSSPSTQKRPKRHPRHPEPAIRLQKSMSCRSLEELELEEVKGFMDLGFKFNKEHLNPRVLKVVPGLRRLGLLNNHKDETEPIDKEEAERDKITEVEEVGEEEEKRDIIRPYLSEAWLIKRPDSPLLSLRVPRVSAAADMKKHLRFWARTVASVIQQET